METHAVVTCSTPSAHGKISSSCYRPLFWPYYVPGTALVAGDESTQKPDQNPPGAYTVTAREQCSLLEVVSRRVVTWLPVPCGCFQESRRKRDEGRNTEIRKEAPAKTQVRDNDGLHSGSALRVEPTDR